MQWKLFLFNISLQLFNFFMRPCTNKWLMKINNQVIKIENFAKQSDRNVHFHSIIPYAFIHVDRF